MLPTGEGTVRRGAVFCSVHSCGMLLGSPAPQPLQSVFCSVHSCGMLQPRRAVVRGAVDFCSVHSCGMLRQKHRFSKGRKAEIKAIRTNAQLHSMPGAYPDCTKIRLAIMICSFPRCEPARQRLEACGSHDRGGDRPPTKFGIIRIISVARLENQKEGSETMELKWECFILAR